jgi:hypothetical protein
MAVSYQLSGQPPGQRFLVVYLTTHEERDTAIDSLPPISHRPEFLGVVPAGAVRRLGPISGLATGEGPRVRVSVRVYTRGATVSTSVRGPYEPYLVCQTREPE